MRSVFQNALGGFLFHCLFSSRLLTIFVEVSSPPALLPSTTSSQSLPSAGQRHLQLQTLSWWLTISNTSAVVLCCILTVVLGHHLGNSSGAQAVISSIPNVFLARVLIICCPHDNPLFPCRETKY